MWVQFSRKLHTKMMATLSSQTGNIIVLQHNKTSVIVIFSNIVVAYAQNWLIEQQFPGSSTKTSKPNQYKQTRTSAAQGVETGR